MSHPIYIINLDPSYVNRELSLFGGPNSQLGQEIMFQAVDMVSNIDTDVPGGLETYLDAWHDTILEYMIRDQRYVNNVEHFIEKALDAVTNIYRFLKPTLLMFFTSLDFRERLILNHYDGLRGYLFIELVQHFQV